MACQSKRPFESIESAQDYLRLLSEELTRVLEELEAERDFASASVSTRYLDAVRLACYKLEKLRQHVQASRRILNDLCLIRGLFDKRGDRVHQSPENAQALAGERELLGL